MSISLGECGSTMVMRKCCLLYRGVFVGVSSGDGWLWISFSVVVWDKILFWWWGFILVVIGLI